MAAATMYATVAGAGGKTGVDWANAFDHAALLNDMKANAEAGDVYNVLFGTYTGVAGWFTTKAGTAAALITVNGVSDQAVPPTIATHGNGPFFSHGANFFNFDGAYWKFKSIQGYGTDTSGALSADIAEIEACDFLNDSVTADRVALRTSGGNDPVLVRRTSAQSDNGVAFHNGTPLATFEYCIAIDSKIGFNVHGTSDLRNGATRGCVTGIKYGNTFNNFYSVVANFTFYDFTTAIDMNGSYPASITNNIFDTGTNGIVNSSNFKAVNEDYNNFHAVDTPLTNVDAGVHDTADDPLFTDAGAGDFTPAAGSPVYTNGTPTTFGVPSPVTGHQGFVGPVAGGAGVSTGPIDQQWVR